MNPDLTVYGFLNPSEAAAYFGVTANTILRWIRTTTPRHIQVELSLLDGTHPLLNGWCLASGGFKDRCGRYVSHSEVEQIDWLRCQHRTDEHQEIAYKRRIAALDFLQSSANETFSQSNYDCLVKQIKFSVIVDT